MPDNCEVPRWQLLKSELENIDPEYCHRLRQQENVILMDVRTEAEFNSGSLGDAVNFDYLAHGFLDKLEELNRDRTYLIFCRTGRRSLRTGILMKNWGFEKIYNLDGGLVAWEEEFGRVTV